MSTPTNEEARGLAPRAGPEDGYIITDVAGVADLLDHWEAEAAAQRTLAEAAEQALQELRRDAQLLREELAAMSSTLGAAQGAVLMAAQEAEHLRGKRDSARRRVIMMRVRQDGGTFGAVATSEGWGYLYPESGAPEGEQQPTQDEHDARAGRQLEAQHAAAYGGAPPSEAAAIEGDQP